MPEGTTSLEYLDDYALLPLPTPQPFHFKACIRTSIELLVHLFEDNRRTTCYASKAEPFAPRRCKSSISWELRSKYLGSLQGGERKSSTALDVCFPLSLSLSLVGLHHIHPPHIRMPKALGPKHGSFSMCSGL